MFRVVTLTALLLSMVSAVTSNGATKTWVGLSSNMAVGSNWSPTGAPSSGDNLIIPSTSNDPVLSSSFTVGNLTISGGATIHANNGLFVLTITGNLTTTGSIDLSSGSPASPIVSFSNASIDQYIYGDDILYFDELRMLKGTNLSTMKSLYAETDVETKVFRFGDTDYTDYEGGYFHLGDNDFTISNQLYNPEVGAFVTDGTGIFTMKATNNVIEYFPVSTEADVSAVSLIRIRNTSGSDDNYSIQSVSAVYLEGYAPGSEVTEGNIDRTWYIDKETAGGSTNIDFFWRTGYEQTDFDRDDCRIVHYDGSDWEDLTTSGSAIEVSLGGLTWYMLAVTGVTSFSPFSVASGDMTLPVKLVDFRAIESDKQVLLKWTTAEEINNDYFVVERSADGHSFREIATKKGNGNTKELISYTLIDTSPIQGWNYYRLKQVDYDGAFEYSNTVTLHHSPNEKVLVTYRINGEAYTVWIDKMPPDYPLGYMITDLSGRKRYVKAEIIKKNSNGRIEISLAGFYPKGLYLIQHLYLRNQTLAKVLVR